MVRMSETEAPPGQGEAMTRRPKSPKRSVVIGRHKTSISLEDAFWLLLKEVAADEGVPVSTVVARIDTDRDDASLSSAVRKYLLSHGAARRSERPGRKSKRL